MLGEIYRPEDFDSEKLFERFTDKARASAVPLEFVDAYRSASIIFGRDDSTRIVTGENPFSCQTTRMKVMYGLSEWSEIVRVTGEK